MSLFYRREFWDWLVCFCLSSILHLAILIVIAIVLIPLSDKPRPLEVEAVLEQERAALVVLNVAPVAPAEAEEAVWIPMAAASVPEIAIGPPRPRVTGQGQQEAGSGSQGGQGQGQADFFGTSSQGDRFVFILDISPSMNARAGQRRIRAVVELLRSIAQLREDQSFYVIVFGWKTRRMFEDASEAPETVPATLENKRRLRDWLKYLPTISGTDPRWPLQVALEMVPDAVFLLSDGQFNRPKESLYFDRPEPDVMDVVRESNPGNTPINAIAFENRACDKAMAAIAAASGGEHRFVPAPKGSPPSRRDAIAFSSHIARDYREAVEEFTFLDRRPERPVSMR